MEKEISFIVPSIRIFDHWKEYLKNFQKFGHDVSKIEVLFIDEGDESTRKKIKEIFSETDFEFFGPLERENFFKENFGKAWQRYIEVIPKRAHAETSFGMLVALQRRSSMVIEVDDDTLPFQEHDFIGAHRNAVGGNVKDVVSTSLNFYNVMENLLCSRTEDEKEVRVKETLYPRGFPYHKRFLDVISEKKRVKGKIVLNQGLWFKIPDFDALNILAEGGMEGHPRVRSQSLKEDTIVVDMNNLVTICSMNVGFDTKIIPAFYQMPMKYMNIDRFDDIWSGFLVKKVADAMGDYVSLGKPCVIHEKAKRDTFKDLKAEMDGMIVNEKLSQMILDVDKNKIENSDYLSGYQSLAEELKKKLSSHDGWMKDYLDYVFRMMLLWSEICEKLQ